MARVYVYAIILIGLPVFLLNLVNILLLSDLTWFFLAAATVVATWFGIRLPLFKKNSMGIAMGDCFVFAGFLLFNPVVAMVIAGAEAIVTNRRQRVQQLSKQLFNLCQAFLVTFIIAHVFCRVTSLSSPMNPAMMSVVTFFEIMGCALLYFVLNTGLVAIAISLSAGQPLSLLWRKRLFLIAPSNLFNVGGAMVIFVTFKPVHFSIPVFLGLFLATCLLVLGFFYTQKIAAFLSDRHG